MPNLSRNPNILLSPVEEGYLAFDTVEEKMHQLNPVAALLTELCDGSLSADELTDLARPHLPPDASDSISDWLQQAESSGLLTRVPVQKFQTRAEDLCSTELVSMSDRLRDQGKTQAAFICQQQATNVEPETASNWSRLGELAHIVGKRVTARDAYQRYLDLNPDDAEVRHLLVSLTDSTPPSRVPDECIRQLYERFSTFYESNMCGELDYEGPQHLLEVLVQTFGDTRGLSVLELGCGTGLAGKILRPFASRLIGVDLSEDMLSVARERNIYDELVAGEITQWLNETDGKFDLIAACDTFIYFGDLRQAIAPAKARLNPGGSIAFSVERAADPPFLLSDSGRYKHHMQHILDVAAEQDLQLTCHHEAFLRMEYGEAVNGHFVSLTAGQ